MGRYKCLKPQITYRGRVELGECISPLSWSITKTLTEWKGMGVHPHPHQAGLIFPSWWNIRQKVDIASLMYTMSLLETLKAIESDGST